MDSKEAVDVVFFPSRQTRVERRPPAKHIIIPGRLAGSRSRASLQLVPDERRRSCAPLPAVETSGNGPIVPEYNALSARAYVKEGQSKSHNAKMTGVSMRSRTEERYQQLVPRIEEIA